MNGMASASSSSASTHDSARHAFNIKVLRRHDPSITHIVYSASFVVLYQYSEATSAWTKTGIEGPMFLYEKQNGARKGYGAFVLNRNGVENWAAGITAQDDLEVTDQFVIFRSAEQQDRLEGSSDDDDEDNGENVIGIWVFEQDQRQAVGEQMTRLQSLADQEDAGPVGGSSTAQQPLPQSQSISLDALFASASSSSTPPAPAAATQSNPQPPSRPAATSSGGPSLLDAIFQSQSQSSPKPPPPPPAAAAPKSSPASTSNSAAAGLMAMLGLGATGTAAAAKEEQRSQPSQQQQQQQQQQRQQKADSPPKPPVAHQQQSTPSPAKSNGVAPASTAPSFQETAKSLLLDAHAEKQDAGPAASSPPMSKGDFVREVLQLIHTDKDFVKGLYEGYLERRPGGK